MSSSGLATPPRAARPRAPEPVFRPPPREPAPRRASFERVYAWSIAVSLLVHLLLLLVSPLVIRLGVPPGATATSQPETETAFGLEMIVAVPSADAPDLPPLEQPDADTPAPPRLFDERPQPPSAFPRQPFSTPAGPPPTAAPGDQSRRSATDALRPGYRDARLYVTPRQFPELEKTEHEQYMEHLQARIDAVNDSMNVAANREATTSDWTVTDGAGRKWGLDGDGLHFGGVTIPRELVPSPRSTGDNASRQAAEERRRQREEILRQEQDRERRETQDERIEATRQNRGQGGGGGGGN